MRENTTLEIRKEIERNVYEYHNEKYFQSNKKKNRLDIIINYQLVITRERDPYHQCTQRLTK